MHLIPSRKLLLQRLAAALLLAFITGHLLAADAESRDTPPSPVTLAEITRETLRERISLSGTSIPRRRVLLSPRVEGLVNRVLVDVGSWVEPGDPILELDDRLAVLGIRTQEARVAEAQSRNEDAVRIRDELLRLKEGRHASETSIESAIAQVAITAAILTREQAELARAQELKDRHAVAAPFAGMIVAKEVEVGQWVQRNDALVELVAMDTLRVQAPLHQRFYPRVAVGAKALVRFDALPERVLDGTLFARVAAGNQSSRSFPLLIDIPNPGHLLAPGMSARVQVELVDGTSDVLMVPRDAVVVRVGGSRRVWRVQEDAGVLAAYPVAVETGRAQGDRLELIGGDLKAGDRVVLLGNENLRPGQEVQPQDRTPFSSTP